MSKINSFLYRVTKVILVYFIVALVFCQVLLNILALVDMPLYLKYSFYLNLGFGTNILVSVFFLLFTFHFRFCSISRAAAIAEFLFCAIYLIIKEDNIYNIWFQIILGTVALGWTYLKYVKKFPLCNLARMSRFFSYLILTGNCSKALEKWEHRTTQLIKEKYHHEYKA